MKGRETPKNQALIILKGFSTVSVEITTSMMSQFTVYEKDRSALIILPRHEQR